MTKQRVTEGSILEINIENQYYVYAQILTESDCAFFDFKSTEKIKDFSVLNTANILFIVAVYSYVITQGTWMKVGKIDIRDSLKSKPMKFIQDSLNPNNFELYNPNDGVITRATREQCEGLEYAAVWSNNHVEDRIRDYYLGISNVWLKQLSIK
jgi:Immunity protein 26